MRFKNIAEAVNWYLEFEPVSSNWEKMIRPKSGRDKNGKRISVLEGQALGVRAYRSPCKPELNK
jgi:hypothetical protein